MRRHSSEHCNKSDLVITGIDSFVKIFFLILLVDLISHTQQSMNDEVRDEFDKNDLSSPKEDLQHLCNDSF